MVFAVKAAPDGTGPYSWKAKSMKQTELSGYQDAGNDAHPWRDKEILRREYIKNKRSLRDLASEWECSKATVRKWLNRHDLGPRSRRGAQQNRRERESKKPWEDEKKVRELYHEQGLTQAEIAERFGCHRKTILRQMREMGVRTKHEKRDRPWEDEATMRELYLEKRLSLSETARRLGASSETIGRWLQNHGIETRDRDEAKSMALREEPAAYWMREDGYMTWRNQYEKKTDVARVHRLLAVAEYGFDAVCGMEVHHKNGIPWANWPENIELMTKAEHARHHLAERNKRT